jgi:tRNA threonylcarbamoyladenosine biosynthesis protein TsaE
MGREQIGRTPDDPACRWRSRSPDGTQALGRALAHAIDPSGLVVALEGGLGAGKTAFVRGLAEGLGIDPAEVASPTFVIASEYAANAGGGPPVTLVHADLYRVERVAELEAAGLLEWLEPGQVVAVEWADRLPEALPADRLRVRLRSVGPAEPETRELEAEALGPGAAAALGRWRKAVDAEQGSGRWR